MIERADDKLSKLQMLHKEDREVFAAEMEGLNKDKKVLLRTNVELSIENRDLKSAITVAKEEITTLQTAEVNLKDGVSALKTAEVGLLLRQNVLETQLQSKSADLNDLNEEFEVQKTVSEKELSILEHKRQDLANEIVENRAQDDKVRENLALWQKKLEDQDSNLRVREGRVNQQEQSVARNYNLLQL